MGLLEGRVAVVSGSTSGIGRAIAERFAAEGAGVVVNSVRSVEAGRALAEELPDAVYVRADVSDDAQAGSLVEAAMARWGRVDVVVNNAGAAAMLDHRDLDGLTDGIWRDMLDANLMSAWYLSRAAVGPLRATGGSIVNISSLAGVHPTGSGSSIAYGVAKAAVNHLTILLADTLGADGIRVNAIAVGPIETPLWNRDLAEVREAMRERTVLGRLGLPAEIAQVCLMLAAPGYTTAQVLVVDGGMRLRVPR